MTQQLRLFAFNCGWFQCRPGFFIEGEVGAYVRSPVPSYLIDHPKGMALFDTGIGEQYRRELTNALPADKFGLQWFEGQEIAARLRSIEVDPSRINWIINSHFHIDHCGGNAQLPNATIIVQQREWDAARSGDNAGLYDPKDFLTGQPVRPVDGEHDLFGDGSVRIIPTYGHTAGHQSVIVRLPAGEILLAGDCCYTERNLNHMALPGLTFDAEEGMRSLQTLQQLRQAGTRILFGHDANQWANIREGVEIE